MRRLVFLVLLVLLAPGAVAAGRADDPVLLGTVGPGFTISLTDAAGNRVTHLDAGEYELRVDDRSGGHNFHLRGPGVDLSTSVDGVGLTTWTVQLQDGQYAYQCDPHNGEMSGGFAVGTASYPTAAPSTPAAPAAPLRLAVTLAPGRLAVSTLHLRAGSYAIAVHDSSRTAAVRLSGPGIARATSVTGVGTVTWRVELAAGSYRVSAGGLSRTLVVAP